MYSGTFKTIYNESTSQTFANSCSKANTSFIRWNNLSVMSLPLKKQFNLLSTALLKTVVFKKLKETNEVTILNILYREIFAAVLFAPFAFVVGERI